MSAASSNTHDEAIERVWQKMCDLLDYEKTKNAAMYPDPRHLLAYFAVQHCMNYLRWEGLVDHEQYGGVIKEKASRE
jgi:hypothetical protein